MKIDRLILGDFQTNCYVVRTEESARECLVIDTGLESRDMVAFLAQHDLTPKAVILTHGHVDHIAGLTALRSKFPGLRVYIHKLDGPMLTDSQANLSEMTMQPFETVPADVLLEDGVTVEEAGIVLKVLHTPGHTPGGICLYAETEAVVFAGDTLFADGVGRTDFPGGDWNRLLDSIRTKLFILPERTVVCPGHGMRTTIGREKASNPFLT
jgi:glyoxylase-like metal-dependent hydrolase (beta-lactamase superfamily II)